MDEAPDTLLSIAVLTDRGYEVRFLADGQGVRIYSKGTLLFKGPQHPHSKLFHIHQHHTSSSEQDAQEHPLPSLRTEQEES